MHIFVDLSNHMIAEAVYQLLLKIGYGNVATGRKPPAKESKPDVLVLDIATLKHGLLSRYPTAKVLLMDTGIEKEKLYATLLSYKIHGVLSSTMEPRLLKRALDAVHEGQIWIDNGSVKALFHDSGAISKAGNTSHVSDREQEIIEFVCQGFSNKEIAQILALSPHTIKAHITRIFRKLNIKSRSQLMSMNVQRRQARSARTGILV